MARDNRDREIEAAVRAALREEAGELWPPPTLWPRVQAGLTRPAEVPRLARHTPDELRALPRRGDLRGLTLALLAEGELDAFTLARRVEMLARRDGQKDLPEGALLPVLHRLVLDGLLEARWRPGPRGLRRAYTLSARGRRVRRYARLTWRLLDVVARVRRLAPRRAIDTRSDGRP